MGGNIKKGFGLGEGGIGEVAFLYQVASKGASVGCGTREFLHRGDPSVFVGLRAGWEMAIGVFIGDILSHGGHEEALGGKEVVGVGELCPPEVVVIIGYIGLLGSKDDSTAWKKGVIGSSNAISIQ